MASLLRSWSSISRITVSWGRSCMVSSLSEPSVPEVWLSFANNLELAVKESIEFPGDKEISVPRKEIFRNLKNWWRVEPCTCEMNSLLQWMLTAQKQLSSLKIAEILLGLFWLWNCTEVHSSSKQQCAIFSTELVKFFTDQLLNFLAEKWKNRFSSAELVKFFTDPWLKFLTGKWRKKNRFSCTELVKFFTNQWLNFLTENIHRNWL